MNKFVLAALSFTAGAAVGFIVGHFVIIEKDEDDRIIAEQLREVNRINKENGYVPDPAEEEVPPEDEPEVMPENPARIAQPGEKGVNYSKVNKIVEEQGLTDPEDIQEVVDDPDNEETYEERVEREEIERTEASEEYRRKNKGKIVPIQKDEFDTDFPEVDYEHKDLYYFTVDDVLTDENGHVVDEAEYIGVKPRQFGWMRNKEDRIYIRNNPKETDFVVWKQRASSSDWWA